MRCWSLWAILCGSVLRDVRCLMYWIRIFPPSAARAFVPDFANRPATFQSGVEHFSEHYKGGYSSQPIYTDQKKFTRDVYAQPQVVLTIQSPNEKDFAAFVQKNAQSIIDFLVKMEMNRQINELEKKHSEVVLYLADSIFSCQFWAPAEIKSYKKGKDFFWASSNTASGLVNICMYSYPYEGPRTFNKQYVLAKRDSVMKANIPGTEPRMYMATDTLCTSVKPIAVKGEYAMETRGLWKMEHDAMGGPFVSHSRVDTLNNRVVVAEGFVYAPEKMKRGLIRRLEAALYTLCLPGEQARELKASIPEVSVVAGKEQE